MRDYLMQVGTRTSGLNVNFVVDVSLSIGAVKVWGYVDEAGQPEIMSIERYTDGEAINVDPDMLAYADIVKINQRLIDAHMRECYAT